MAYENTSRIFPLLPILCVSRERHRTRKPHAMTSRSDTRQEKEAQAARGPLTLLCYAILYLLGCTLIAQGILILYVSKTYEISLAHVGYLCLVPAVVQAVTTFLNGFHPAPGQPEEGTARGPGLGGRRNRRCPLGVVAPAAGGPASAGVRLRDPHFCVQLLDRVVASREQVSEAQHPQLCLQCGCGIAGPAFLGADSGRWRSLAAGLGLGLRCSSRVLSWYAVRIPFSSIAPPRTTGDSRGNETAVEGRWHLSIYLIGAAMLFYVLSESTFSTWIVSYLKLNLGLTSPTRASGLQSIGCSLRSAGLGPTGLAAT